MAKLTQNDKKKCPACGDTKQGILFGLRTVAGKRYLKLILAILLTGCGGKVDQSSISAAVCNFDPDYPDKLPECVPVPSNMIDHSKDPLWDLNTGPDVIMIGESDPDLTGLTDVIAIEK